MEELEKTSNGQLAGIAGKVAEFADFLKTRGYRIFQSSIHDALMSLTCIDILNRDDFLTALRSALVTNDMEWSQFPGLFNEFWGRYLYAYRTGEKKDKGKTRPVDKELKDTVLEEDSSSSRASDSRGDFVNKEWLEGVAYSPVSRVEKTDITRFDNADIQVAQLALKKITEPFRVQISRRSKKGLKRGPLDFPRIMRHTFRSGGFTFRLFYRKKKKKLKRLIIVADVSGSMERYAQFVVPFVLGSIRGTGSKTEAYVFSTSLTRITFTLKHLPLEKALEQVRRDVPDWSGGTRIGFSLKQLDEEDGGLLVDKNTVLLIMSDGWDLGGKALLRNAMERLKNKAHSIIWLNPLADDPDFRPMCRGMQEALPYIDYFMPVNSLEGLKRVGRLLSRVMLS